MNNTEEKKCAFIGIVFLFCNLSTRVFYWKSAGYIFFLNPDRSPECNAQRNPAQRKNGQRIYRKSCHLYMISCIGQRHEIAEPYSFSPVLASFPRTGQSLRFRFWGSVLTQYCMFCLSFIAFSMVEKHFKCIPCNLNLNSQYWLTKHVKPDTVSFFAKKKKKSPVILSWSYVFFCLEKSHLMKRLNN